MSINPNRFVEMINQLPEKAENLDSSVTQAYMEAIMTDHAELREKIGAREYGETAYLNRPMKELCNELYEEMLDLRTWFKLTSRHAATKLTSIYLKMEAIEKCASEE